MSRVLELRGLCLGCRKEGCTDVQAVAPKGCHCVPDVHPSLSPRVIDSSLVYWVSRVAPFLVPLSKLTYTHTGALYSP